MPCPEGPLRYRGNTSQSLREILHPAVRSPTGLKFFLPGPTKQYIDPAHRRDMSHVVVHHGTHLLKMHLYLKRILSEQQRFHGLDARSRRRLCCASFAIAGKAAIGVDPNQDIPGILLSATAERLVIFTFFTWV